MPRSILIDASSHIHRDWHIAKVAEQAVRVFIRRIEAFNERLHPDRIVVCFDSGRSFRTELDPGYKSNRPEKDGDLRRALELAKQKVVEFGFDALWIDGYEGDDLIATLTAQDVSRGWQVVMSSSDKDLRQLLIDGQVTQMVGWAKQLHEPIDFQWMNAKQLLAKEGMTPQQWLEYQILAGDPGDNVKGCPGIGEVTAKKLVVKHGLDALLGNPWLIAQRAMREKFTAWKPMVDVARALVTLRRDVPLPEAWTIEACA